LYSGAAKRKQSAWETLARKASTAGGKPASVSRSVLMMGRSEMSRWWTRRPGMESSQTSAAAGLVDPKKMWVNDWDGTRKTVGREAYRRGGGRG